MEQLTLLQGDSLASLTASPGSEEATRMTVRSGRKCSESYQRQGPLGCLVRMCLESSRWHSTVCLLTWRLKDTPAKRSVFQLAASMPGTDENESGLWPTARATDGDKGSRTPEGALKELERGRNRDLGMMTVLWPTPRAGKTSDENQETWQKRADAGNVATPPLTLAVKMWPSPTASTGGPEPEGKTGRKLATIVGGSLNPNWVEWLMGYPVGWTDCADSETPSCRKARRRSSPQ